MEEVEERMADKTATIEFDEYPDVFVVRLSPIPLDDWLDIDARVTSFRTREDLLEVIDRFCTVAFLGWEGSDTEPTAANLRKYDTQVILALIQQWSKAIAEAPLPLPRRPGSGGPSKARKASRSRRN